MLSATLQLHRPGWSLDARLDMRSGVLGLVGPSGCGKTTLLQALAGLVRPAAGRIELAGRVLLDTVAGVDVPVHRRRIAVAFQDHRLWPHLSVRRNLLYSLRRTPRPRRRFTLEQVADWLGIAPLLGRRVPNLSGGEARRVSLARALLSSPDLLLLDEPMTGLDPDTCERTLLALGRIIRETQVPTLIVSHQHEQLLRLTREIVTIAGGRTGAASQSPGQALPNCFRLRVTEADPLQGLLRLETEGGASCGMPLVAAWQRGLSRGDCVLAMLDPEQVVLAMAPVETVSMQNRARGVIDRLEAVGGGVLCSVRLTGGVVCRAMVTRHAAGAFDLAPGRPIWCLFKATALRVQRDLTGGAMAPDLHKSLLTPTAGSDCLPPRLQASQPRWASSVRQCR